MSRGGGEASLGRGTEVGQTQSYLWVGRGMAGPNNPLVAHLGEPSILSRLTVALQQTCSQMMNADAAVRESGALVQVCLSNAFNASSEPPWPATLAESESVLLLLFRFGCRSGRERMAKF